MLRAIMLCAVISASASALEPAETFHQLEQRLLQAKSVQVQFELKAEGAHPADFRGELYAQLPRRVELKSEGHFAGEQMTLSLVGEEGRMSGGRNGEEAFDEEADHLWAAVVFGMTRMGLLHNHAQLSAEATPDHANEAVEGWLETRDHAWSPRLEEIKDAFYCIAFALDVSGQHSADIVLWLDADGMPRHREQTVYFEGGSMTAIESYRVQIADPQRTCPACRQPLRPFGHTTSVDHDFSRIYVCCPTCAEKLAGRWDGYLGIVHAMGEDTQRLPQRVDRFVMHENPDAAPCSGCSAGLCNRPEYLPPD